MSVKSIKFLKTCIVSMMPHLCIFMATEIQTIANIYSLIFYSVILVNRRSAKMSKTFKATGLTY